MLNLLIQSGEKMLKIDRHSYILDELKTKHLVRVSKLAHDMKVTEMTIRRDLQELEDYGHLTRIHGGAKLKPKNFYQEDNYNKKIEFSRYLIREFLIKVTVGWAAVPVSAVFWLYETYILKRKDSIMLYDKLLNMRVVAATEQPKVEKVKEDKEK